MKMFSIMTRHKILINTDPQRRCYNGCHFSSELVWSEWDLLQCNIPEGKTEDRLKFWRELNDYAVSQRGESARAEFKLEEQKEKQNEKL